MGTSKALLKSRSISSPAGINDKANACSSFNTRLVTTDSDKGSNGMGAVSNASKGKMAVISPEASVSNVAGISMASITSPNDHVPCTSGTAKKQGPTFPVNVVSSSQIELALGAPSNQKGRKQHASVSWPRPAILLRSCETAACFCLRKSSRVLLPRATSSF